MALTDRQINALSASMQGEYEHYKGQRYQVLGLARHSETEQLLVVYKTLYGEQTLWVRPHDMFTSQVIIDGAEIPRFKKLKPDHTD